MEQIQFRRQKNKGKQFRRGSMQLVLFQTEFEKTKLFEIEKRELKVRNPLEKFFNATPRGDDELDRLKFLTEGRGQMVPPVDKNVLTRFTSEAVTLFMKPSFSRATKTLFSILVYNT